MIRITKHEPARGREVLVCTGYKPRARRIATDFKVAYRDVYGWYNRQGSTVSTPTHWMPLPELDA